MDGHSLSANQMRGRGASVCPPPIADAERRSVCAVATEMMLRVIRFPVFVS